MKPLAKDWQSSSVGPLSASMRIAQRKVISWIESGELVAYNIATHRDKRPVYRIERKDFDRFWSSRATVPPTPTPPRRNRGTRAPVREFV